MDDRLEELLELSGVKAKAEKQYQNKRHIFSRKDKKKNEDDSNYNRKRSVSEPTPVLLNDDSSNTYEPDDDIEEFIPEFYNEVGQTKSLMSTIRRNTKKIQDKYLLALNSVNASEEGVKFEAEIQEMIDSNKSLFMQLKKKLELMKKNTEIAISKHDDTNVHNSTHDTEERIRTSIHKTLTMKFVEMMREFQDLQNTYKNKYKEKMENQYKVVHPDATNQEIQEALESGDAQKIFIEKTLYLNLHSEAQKALAYIQQKHNDIIQIEKNVAELHQMFLDMAMLVEIHGEILQQIEANVESSVLEIKEGNENLRMANKLHKRFIFF